MAADERLVTARFPRASRYNPDWILAGVSGGANPLWLTEWLSESLDLGPGMRILDLGCGRALSSIFLHLEFGVQVWATDLWFNASENLQRIRDAGAGDGVLPLHADARSLPFGAEFFDAAISIDSFPYYGTDDLYLNYLARFVKPRDFSHCRRRPNKRDRGTSSFALTRLVDPRFMLPALRIMVAATLGKDIHRGPPTQRFNA